MEWILALHEGDGDDVGARWPLRRSVGAGDVLGAVGCGVRLGREVPSPRYVKLFTTLRTISSNGAAVKAPACTGPLERSGPLTAGSGDDLAVPTTSSPRVQPSGWDELDGRASLPYQRTGVGRRPRDGGT